MMLTVPLLARLELRVLAPPAPALTLMTAEALLVRVPLVTFRVASPSLLSRRAR